LYSICKLWTYHNFRVKLKLQICSSGQFLPVSFYLFYQAHSLGIKQPAKTLTGELKSFPWREQEIIMKGGNLSEEISLQGKRIASSWTCICIFIFYIPASAAHYGAISHSRNPHISQYTTCALPNSIKWIGSARRIWGKSSARFHLYCCWCCISFANNCSLVRTGKAILHSPLGFGGDKFLDRWHFNYANSFPVAFLRCAEICL
jgi:hypothetical protein